MSERSPKRPKEYHYTADGSETWKELTEVGRFGYDNPTVFRDFIDIGLASLLSLTHNLQYPDLIGRLRS
jgi:hypothetical protein